MKRETVTPSCCRLPHGSRSNEELEELDDIRAYDEAKAQPSEPVPFKQAVREIQDRRVD
jgi:hypothetical protein